jgi:hypothetical protein
MIITTEERLAGTSQGEKAIKAGCGRAVYGHSSECYEATEALRACEIRHHIPQQGPSSAVREKGGFGGYGRLEVN